MVTETQPASDFAHKRFWAVLEERHPEEIKRRAHKARLHWQRGLPENALVVTMFINPTQSECGVCLGRNKSIGAVDVEERLKPFQDRINEQLGLDPAQSFPDFPFASRWSVDCYDEDNWPAMVDWMVTEASRYERVLSALLRGSSPNRIAGGA